MLRPDRGFPVEGTFLGEIDELAVSKSAGLTVFQDIEGASGCFPLEIS